jgi:formiminoglutamase
MSQGWLEIIPGTAPLIVSIPHAGTEIPEPNQPALASLWLARKDADWWLPQLYSFAESLGATIIRTHISRTVIDVNRDPSGISLYPGQTTTGLCPVTTFDGEALYRDGFAPDAIDARIEQYFTPYHQALTEQATRLRQSYETIVLYDCHSIRSCIPRLFEGELPNFNIGTNDGKSCAPELAEAIVNASAAAPDFTHVLNGRFKGGYITRAHGNPVDGIHAVQMELACRGYMQEPETPDETNWPPMFDAAHAAPMQAVLQNILNAALKFTLGKGTEQ